MPAADVYLKDAAIESVAFSGGTVERLDPEQTAQPTLHINFNDSRLPAPGTDLQLFAILNNGNALDPDVAVVSQRAGMVSVYSETDVDLSAVKIAAEAAVTQKPDALATARFGEPAESLRRRYTGL